MAGIAASILSFIALPSPERFCLNRSPQCPEGATVNDQELQGEPESSDDWDGWDGDELIELTLE